MMNLIKLMAFGLLVFGVSAGGSYFARLKQLPAEVASDEHGATEHGDAESTQAEAPHGQAAAAAAHAPAEHSDDDERPVVVRPKMLTPEDILRGGSTRPILSSYREG